MKKSMGQKGAWTVKIGEKGQFVIPKEARDMLGIKPGDNIIVLADANRGLAIPPKAMFSELMTNVFKKTLDDLDDDTPEE